MKNNNNEVENIINNILDNSKTIAIIGLSPKPEKISNVVGKFLIENNFNVIPIYPNENKILGKKAYNSIEEVKENIDTVVIFRKSEYIPKIIEEIVKFNNKNKNNIKNIWLQLGITSLEGKNIAQKNNINYVENRCIKIEYSKKLKNKK